jgi:hypothetical protein
MRRPRYQAAVIDDNDGLRKLLVECLLFSDVDVEGFPEAEEFLRRLSPLNQSPTAVVPDLAYPLDDESILEVSVLCGAS